MLELPVEFESTPRVWKTPVLPLNTMAANLVPEFGLEPKLTSDLEFEFIRLVVLHYTIRD